VICIEGLESVFTNNFIITVHHYYNRVIAAYVVYGIVGVLKSRLSYMVLHVNVFVFWNREKVKVFTKYSVRAIIRVIVDDDSHVISIILSKDRVEIILNPLFFIVVVRSHDHTYRKFLLELRKSMLSLLLSVIFSFFVSLNPI
jgi:hypothetical protein